MNIKILFSNPTYAMMMPTRKERMMARFTMEMAMMLVVVVGIVSEVNREVTVTMYRVEKAEKCEWRERRMDIHIAMNEELSKAKRDRMNMLMTPATWEVVEKAEEIYEAWQETC